MECDAIFSIGASFSYNTIPESIRTEVLNKIIDLDAKINNLNDIKVLIDALNDLGHSNNDTHNADYKIKRIKKIIKNILINILIN